MNGRIENRGKREQNNREILGVKRKRKKGKEERFWFLNGRKENKGEQGGEFF